jgi:hypothetical protein
VAMNYVFPVKTIVLLQLSSRSQLYFWWFKGFRDVSMPCLLVELADKGVLQEKRFVARTFVCSRGSLFDGRQRSLIVDIGDNF